MPGGGLAVRVISLGVSHERRALVRQNLADFPLPWAFLDASTPADTLGLRGDPAVQAISFGRALTPGETACFNSHARALEVFESEPALRWLLVIEDDVWIDPFYPYEDLTAWLEEKSIGFLRLFAREWRHGFPRYWFRERQVLFLTTDPHGAQAYLISRDTARAFRQRLLRVERPIDDEFGRFWENGLDNHLLFPFPVVERHAVSTLNPARKSANGQPRRSAPARSIVRVRDFMLKRAYLAYRLSPFATDRIRPRKR